MWPCSQKRATAKKSYTVTSRSTVEELAAVAQVETGIHASIPTSTSAACLHLSDLDVHECGF